MPTLANEPVPSAANIHLVLAYVADLELEVDRLRKQGQFVQQEVRVALRRIRAACGGQEGNGHAAGPLADIDHAAQDLWAVLRDFQEAAGYHPAHDQVVAIAVRPLAEQVFRWQVRLQAAPGVSLRFDLEAEAVEWFPGRLRHILDNLFSNALRYRDPGKEEAWVRLSVRISPARYEIRITDNGVGLPVENPARMFDLFYRAAPTRAAGLGVGLPVAKLLVEQSGGTLTVDSGEGRGTSFLVTLPRYDIDDFLV